MDDSPNHRHLDTILLIEPELIPHEKAMDAIEHTGRCVERTCCPVSAFAELCLLERQYASRRNLGMPLGNRPALLIDRADECNDLTDMVNAALLHLRLVEVWAIRSDGIHVFKKPIEMESSPEQALELQPDIDDVHRDATPHAEHVEKEARPETKRANGHHTVGQEEIAMLLGPVDGDPA